MPLTQKWWLWYRLGGASCCVAKLIEAVEKKSLLGINDSAKSEIPALVRIIDKYGDMYQAVYPKEITVNVMDPDEGIDFKLIRCFFDHVMPTPGPGQAWSGFNEDEPYDRY
jgi:hypothetical protein